MSEMYRGHRRVFNHLFEDRNQKRLEIQKNELYWICGISVYLGGKDTAHHIKLNRILVLSEPGAYEIPGLWDG